MRRSLARGLSVLLCVAVPIVLVASLSGAGSGTGSGAAIEVNRSGGAAIKPTPVSVPASAAVAASTPRYGRDIRPLLSDRCFKCHGPDAASRKAGLRLDDPACATAAIDDGGDKVWPLRPGDPDGSEVWRRISSDDPDEVMPPPESGKKALSAEERELIRRWIAGGATYEPHWAFVPARRPPVPAVNGSASSWCRNDIDRFIASRLEAEAIASSPEADRETLVRRVFLDLTGLPPTPEEVDAFLADANPDAYERLVDRLLGEDPYRARTAERLATPWMDASRYADTCGIHTDNGRQMWAWRDWVLAAFRDNMPFDQFVTEQLAGDLLPDATLAQKVASGFNRNHITTDEGGAIPEEYLVEYAVDRATTTASVLLGLTLNCARCHDHKFDPISNEDFYRFYAFFNSVDEPGLYSQTPDSNRAYEPFIDVPTPEQSRVLAELAKAVEDLKAQQAMTTPDEERQYADFKGRSAAEFGVSWAASQVVAAKSAGGATLTPRADGAVLASGENPPTDVHEYTLRLQSGGSDLRLLLIEALDDPSLPLGRTGRAFNGNAVLTGVEIQTVNRADPSKTTTHDAMWVWSDISQMDGDYRYTNVLIAPPNRGTDRGWAVDNHRQGGTRRLLVLVNQPFSVDDQTDVRVVLKYESTYTQHVFGCVRLTLGRMKDITKLPPAMGTWRIAGPFPVDKTDAAYDAAFGPESATNIDFAQNFGAGNQYWRYDANLRDGAPVRLVENGVNVIYVGRMIYAPVACDLPVSLGSDDGFRLFVNGKEVAGKKIDRSLAPDQDQATIPLQAGANCVVLKIINTGGESGYYFKPRVSDEIIPDELVAAVLPESAQAGVGEAKIRQAWKLSRFPQYRENQAKIDELAKQAAQTQSGIAKTMVMRELPTPRPTFVLKRGQYDAPDTSRPVTRAIPAALGKLPEGEPLNRLGLARWIVSADNPLTARVMVNRLWEMFFGTGLVRTSEDFGQQGEWPSNLELLDWLAVEYREGGGGWDTRRMIRLIVTSAAYRQSSVIRRDARERDPDDRLLWAFPRRRLSAEQIRDNALYVSGLLVEKFGGPSVKPYQPEGLWREGALPASNTQVFERGKGEDLWRRSLYTYWKRAVPPPSMQAFDAPTRESCVVRRINTATPLQALVLWNDPQFVEAARVLAQRTLNEPGADDERLALMFKRCTSRRPGEKELRAMANALAAFRARYASKAEDADKLVTVGDAPVPEGLDRTELAAWTMVASSVLNLYRTNTQE